MCGWQRDENRYAWRGPPVAKPGLLREMRGWRVTQEERGGLRQKNTTILEGSVGRWYMRCDERAFNHAQALKGQRLSVPPDGRSACVQRGVLLHDPRESSRHLPHLPGVPLRSTPGSQRLPRCGERRDGKSQWSHCRAGYGPARKKRVGWVARKKHDHPRRLGWSWHTRCERGEQCYSTPAACVNFAVDAPVCLSMRSSASSASLRTSGCTRMMLRVTGLPSFVPSPTRPSRIHKRCG